MMMIMSETALMRSTQAMLVNRAHIVKDVHLLKNTLDRKLLACKSMGKNTKIIATSGGFDPLHIGHLRCIQDAAHLYPDNILVVIVNGDGFLERKKGKPFMKLEERMEIIAGLSCVDYVVSWDDGSQFVSKCLEIIEPDIFAKGGDRSKPEDVPEYQICKKIGCEIVFNVGGGKIQSSSNLIKNVRT